MDLPGSEPPDLHAQLAAQLAAVEAQLDAQKAAHRQAIKARDLEIEKLKHLLAGMRRHRFGSSSESLEQLELSLEEVELAAAAEEPPEPQAGSETKAPAKKKPKRAPLPSHLPRTDEVLSPGETCTCGGHLRAIGEDVTEELEYIPGRFVVRRIIRPRLACTACEAITQAELPSRPIERGRPGPGLLAHVLVSKYADHLPLYRQSQIYQRDGLELSRSTLADWVGKSTALLAPLADAIGHHVRAGPALFADDTPLDLQDPGGGKTKTARLWVYARDERPWAGPAPPAAWYQFSVDRKGKHALGHLADFKGWMHADGYAGFNELYRRGQVDEVACMAHIRRKFVDVHQAQGHGTGIAEEALRRIAELYAVEAEARGHSPDTRVQMRQEKAKPAFDDLEAWLGTQLARISAKTPLAVAIRYALTRLKRLRPYLSNGELELDNNPAERAMRAVALGRKNWLFAGSTGGGKAAAIAYTLIETAKLNGVDPQAWLTHILANIADQKINKLDEFMPWNFVPA